jgi:hypothetical protein
VTRFRLLMFVVVGIAVLRQSNFVFEYTLSLDERLKKKDFWEIKIFWHVY